MDENCFRLELFRQVYGISGDAKKAAEDVREIFDILYTKQVYSEVPF